MTTHTEPLTDPRPVFSGVLDHAGEVVAVVRIEDLELPTPCGTYDVRDLLGHLAGVLRRVAHVFTGGHPLDVAPTTSDVADGAWHDQWLHDRVPVDEALLDDQLLTRQITVPWGVVPGAAAIVAYCGEVTTHTWDLATAIGRTDLLDEEIGAFAAAMAHQFVPAEPRGGEVPFGPVVKVDDNADPYARLAGWMGRNPLWQP